MNLKLKTAEWKKNEPVQGVYMGQPYKGTIGELSRMGPNGVFIFVIYLDEPVMVFGHIRKVIEIWDNDGETIETREK